MNTLQDLDRYAVLALSFAAVLYVGRIALALTFAAVARMVGAMSNAGVDAVWAARSVRMSPRLTRGLAIAVVGGGLTLTAAPAHAHTPVSEHVVTALDSRSWQGAAPTAALSTAPVVPGWNGATPVVPGWNGATPVVPPPKPTSDVRIITVDPGDSLWSITAALLGPRSDAADIARGWPILYSANRNSIGGDPSLIMPGTVLHIPSALYATSPTRSTR